jgi:hypothetical protein
MPSGFVREETISCVSAWPGDEQITGFHFMVFTQDAKGSASGERVADLEE